MDVELLPSAETELHRLPRQEQTAMLHAIDTLRASGPTLGYPHTSQVRGTKLRELRPRGGNSPWRAFYRRIGDVLRIGAIGPEAKVNPRGFNAAVDRATRRLDVS
jgi:hypothetical protein